MAKDPTLPADIRERHRQDLCPLEHQDVPAEGAGPGVPVDERFDDRDELEERAERDIRDERDLRDDEGAEGPAEGTGGSSVGGALAGDSGAAGEPGGVGHSAGTVLPDPEGNGPAGAVGDGGERPD